MCGDEKNFNQAQSGLLLSSRPCIDRRTIFMAFNRNSKIFMFCKAIYFIVKCSSILWIKVPLFSSEHSKVARVHVNYKGNKLADQFYRPKSWPLFSRVSMTTSRVFPRQHAAALWSDGWPSHEPRCRFYWHQLSLLSYFIYGPPQGCVLGPFKQFIAQ